ncbi:MAG: insulinase family protein [Pseudomonadota bacterium]
MKRLPSSAAFLSLLFALAVPALAQNVPAAAAPRASWLHEGSDIPADPAWITGTLPNGLRYAVRRNATPPGTVALRVRIDAGALMESDEQSGWAHLLEHMVFRGTRTRPDGEAVKLWQRLGASFGSDSNASTTLRATTYKLDLPRNDAGSLDEAVGALADMMQNARIDARLLDTERKVVMAERAARITPTSRRIQDAVKPLMYAGLLAEKRELGGTDASLAAATAAGLQGFYDRWYRPERAVVVMVGDADPALLENLVKRKFGGWRSAGSAPAEPAYGSPTEPARRIALVVDPLTSAGLQLAWVTPHRPGKVTAETLRADTTETVSLRVLNQRLSEQALKGGPMLGASVRVSRARSLADTVSLSISPRNAMWAEALAEAYGVLNRTLAAPVDPAEIDQQTASIGEALNRAVDASQTWPSTTWANAYVDDVDSGDVAADRRYYAGQFRAQKPTITPAAVQSALKTLFAPQPRLLILAAAPVAGGEAAVADALTKARATDGGAAVAIRTVTLDMVSPPLPPGKVTRERTIVEFGIDRVTFANGVELVMKKTDFARDAISVEVRIGQGVSGRAVNDRSPDWSAGVVAASGIGDVTLPELARLTAGRQIGFGMAAGTDAASLGTTTNPRDLADALRLVLAGATRSRGDPVALNRYRAGYLASLKSIQAQPQSVFQVMGATALYGGDRRFQPIPTPAEVNRTDIAAIRAHWAKVLGEGPVRVVVVGDLDRAATIRAVAATFGALPPRPATTIDPATQVVPPLRTDVPVMLTHKGDPNQALVAVAWRTFGALTNLKAARAMAVATTIIQNRLNEEFRETEGGTYSPFVTAMSVAGFDSFGQLMVGAQLTPDRIQNFYATLDRIVADLAAKGPSADALIRARETAVGAAQRSIAGNAYWSGILSRDLDDPRQLESVRTYVSGRRAVDAGAVQAVIRTYLVDARPLRIEVRPEPKTIPTAK